MAETSASLFRTRTEQGHHRVTFVELFFDLVFVFAVTQLAHTLAARFTPLGILQTSMLMLAVWWVWMYTSWITNWLDPDRGPVRFMLFALMLGGLALSIAIPEAFEIHGLVFACAYAGMQVGRTIFMLWAIPTTDVPMRRDFTRVVVWLVLAAVAWVVGGGQDGPTRLALWGVALALEYLGPSLRFWTPGLGASSVRDWAIDGGHMAERCALFIIIALGESVLDTGAAFATSTWTPTTSAAFGVAFVSSVAMWWIYFDKGAEPGSEKISHASDPGRLARLAYTYLHLPIVAAVILSAVADEIIVRDASGAPHAMTIVSVLGAPALYLLGVLLFKRAVRGRLWQLSHLVGIAALVGLVPLASRVSPLALATMATAVLVIVALWESRSLRSTALDG